MPGVVKEPVAKKKTWYKNKIVHNPSPCALMQIFSVIKKHQEPRHKSESSTNIS